MGGSTRRIYPKANTTAQWYETAFSRGTFSRIEKILLHTTETTGWPGYSSGSMAPTLTYHPRQRAWRQHNYLDTSARALVDPSTTPVRENRDNVIQIEIIAYADEAKGRSVGGLPVSQLTDDMLKDLGEFIGWVHEQWGGPPLVAAKFIPYPSSYGNSSVRMTSSQYDAFQGVLGHQHASGNAHGDPGALNVPRIMQHAAAYGGIVTPAPTPAQEWYLMADIPADNLAQIADAVWAKMIDHPSEAGRQWPARTGLWSANVYAYQAATKALDLDALAASIVAKLPSDATGGLTMDQVRAASELALRDVLGSVDENPSAT